MGCSISTQHRLPRPGKDTTQVNRAEPPMQPRELPRSTEARPTGRRNQNGSSEAGSTYSGLGSTQLGPLRNVYRWRAIHGMGSANLGLRASLLTALPYMPRILGLRDHKRSNPRIRLSEEFSRYEVGWRWLASEEAQRKSRLRV